MIKIFDEEKINPDIPGIILLSHSNLAVAMLQTAEFINGDIENIAAFSFEDEDNPEDYRDSFVEAIKKFPNNSIIFMDIFGGSPCNQLIIYAKRNQLIFNAIAGMNLPLVVTAVNLREVYSGEEFLEKLVEEGSNGIVNVTKMLMS